MWSARKSSRLNVDEHSNSRCRQLLDSLHRLLVTFTMGFVMLAFAVWAVGSGFFVLDHYQFVRRDGERPQFVEGNL